MNIQMGKIILFFLEKDKNYRTIKHDPDVNFMESLK